MRKQLFTIGFLYYLHLTLFVIAISLAMYEGQGFRLWYFVHIVASYVILIRDKGSFHIKIGYLLLLPSFVLFELVQAATDFEIPPMTWALNIGFALCLYLMIPIVVSNRALYESAGTRSASPSSLKLSMAAFELVKDRIPEEDAETIRGLIYEHEEWGQGVEAIVDVLLEHDISVTTEQRDAILEAMNAMSLERSQHKLRVTD
jgi:hypothetical protein